MRETKEELVKKVVIICDDCKDEILSKDHWNTGCSACKKDLCSKCGGEKIYIDIDMPDNISFSYGGLETFVCRECYKKYECLELKVSSAEFIERITR